MYRKPPRRAGLPLLAVTLGGALTGFSGILLRYSEIGPVATGGWRLLIGTLAFAPLVAFARIKDGTPFPASLTLALAGLFFALDISFFHLSLGLTSVAHSTLIVHLSPVVVLTAGVLFFGERLGVLKVVGMIAALGGTLLMTSLRANTGGTLEGNGLAVLSMVAYSFYLLAVKRARRGHGTLAIMLWSSAASAVCLFGAAIALGEPIIPATVNGWAVVFAMGLVTHVGGQGLIAFGMRETPVGLGSILLLTPPVVAAIAAWPLFGERLTLWEIVGAAFVLAGLALASQTRG